MPYNPILTISGNGIQGQVTATFTTGTSFWNITSRNLPGQALTGTFPNASNPYAISTQTINVTWPVRGGKNLPNTAFRPITPAGDVGISSIGVLLYNPRSTITVAGQNNTTWTVNAVDTGIFAQDEYGGKPTSTGLYNYVNGNFIRNNAWGSISSSTWQGFVFNREKRSQELNIIIDSLASDLLFDSASQIAFVGAEYWKHTGYVSEVARQLNTLTNTINYVRDLSKKIILNDTSGPRYQNTFTQSLSGPIAASGQQITLDQEFKLITDILNNGPTGYFNKIITNNLEPSDNVNIQSAYNKLQANKQYIQREALAYIESNKGFTYDENITEANTELLINSVVLDLLFSGSTQSTFSGLEHWNKGNFVGPIPGQLSTTTNTFLYLQDLVQQVVTNDTTGTRYQSTVTQNVSLPSATLAEKLMVHDSVDHILNVITNDGYELNNNIVFGNTEITTSTNILRAYNLLNANRTYIQSEIVAYVQATKTPNLVYNAGTLYSEISNVINAISFDLLYDGNLQSIMRGSSYFSYNPNSSAIPNQQTQTIAAYTYLRSLIPFIVTGSNIVPLQNIIPQVRNLTPATAIEASIAQTKVDTVNNIISSGPGVAAQLTPLGLSKTVNTNLINAANYIKANINFLKREVIQFINNRYAFTYDQTEYLTNFGYIIDSVSFDLLYSGNMQAIKRGISYWDYSSTDSDVENEKPQINDSFNYLKSVITNVIINNPLTTRYQQEYQQITNLSGGTITESILVSDNIDYLLSIINTATNISSSTPINLTRNASTEVINAANVIIANKDFIRREVIGYLDDRVASKTGIYASGDTGVYTYYTDGHSKIIGWARDGYPIYGPYGYLIATDIFSTVVKMTSGYRKINNVNRPVTRTVVVNGSVSQSNNFAVYNSAGLSPGMTLENSQFINNIVKIISVVGTRVTVNSQVDLLTGSTLVARYDIGSLIEDYIYQPSSGDLDQHNGRFCVTPDFPEGTYAYFITEDEDENPTYPYIIGPNFYGSTLADSTDSTLLNLVPEIGSLTPTFSSTITNYSITLDNETENIRFRAFVNNQYATLKVDGTTTTTGDFSPYISLAVGQNTTKFLVTSQYLLTTEYNVVTTRLQKNRKGISQLRVTTGSLDPSFNQSTFTYSITYDKTIAFIEITATVEFIENTLKINNNSVLSNTPYRVNLVFGENLINIKVFAEDNSFIDYNITAIRLSDVSGLLGISTNVGNITPTFDGNVYNYFLTVSNTTSTIQVSAIPVDINSTIFVNAVQTNANSLSLPVPLQVGSNPIGIRVISSDESVSINYRLNVFREYSSIATLDLITPSQGQLIPTFNSNTLTYTLDVSNAISSITFTVTPGEYTEVITVNGLPIGGTYSSTAISLNVGANIVNISVTSGNSIFNNNYIITVTRAPSTISSLTRLGATNVPYVPNFSSTVFNYTGTVSYNVLNTVIIPVKTDPNATIFVNNQSVVSGQESQSIPLSVGTNTVNTVVVAQDGISSSTYKLNVIRKANFDATASLITTNTSYFEPLFDPYITSYKIYVPNDVSQINFEVLANDRDASSITLTSDLYNSTATSVASFTVPLVGYITTSTAPPSWIGETNISIDILAADNQTHKIYGITVYKSAPTNSFLSNLTIQQGTLTPDFNSTVTNYYFNVPYVVDKLNVKPVASDAMQTIVLYGLDNPTVLVSNTFSNAINIYLGNNVIPILVYAADQNYYTGYNINVNRAPKGLDDDPVLSNLETDIGKFETIFSSDSLISAYVVKVPFDARKIRVKATARKTFTTIKINEKITTSGTFSDEINLDSLGTGQLNIDVNTTAQDNTTKRNYRLSVQRSQNTLSKLTNLKISYGVLNRTFDPNITQYTVEVRNEIDRMSLLPMVDYQNVFMAINNLPTDPNRWTTTIDLAVGRNTLTLKVVSGDLNNTTLYQIIVTRAEPGNVIPTDLFLSDGINLSASLYKSEILKIFTKANTNLVEAGSTTPLQNIELLIPYRGAKNEQSDIPTVTGKDTILGITVVGIPIRSPKGISIDGLENTTWTLNRSVVFNTDIDFFGGIITDPNGYYYIDGRFNFSNSWDQNPQWQTTFHADGHSRILGFAIDGYPIYGNFGYREPLNRFSGIESMISGYQIVNDINRPPVIPVVYNGNQLGNQIQLNDVTNLYIGMRIRGGPIPDNEIVDITDIDTSENYVSLSQGITFGPFASDLYCSFDLGTLIEDYQFNVQKFGRTLDKHNGRYCVTPDYPFGTYAYFITGQSNLLEYPYIIGNTFYGKVINLGTADREAPRWITPPGVIFTATEGVSITKNVVANNSATYKLISGKLPSGLNLTTSTGVISGRPNVVYQLETSKFILRATNQWGISDREFAVDVKGATPPIIDTAGPVLRIGPDRELYVVNGQIVDFQFSAKADILPPGKSLFYFIKEGEGQLPPGLILTSTGKLYGQVKDNLALFYRAATNGNYDMESYDQNPYEHVSQSAFGIQNKFVNKVYKFFLSVSTGVATSKAEYTIYVNDPATYIGTENYPISPQWITPSNLGSFRSNSNVVIKLESFDCDPGGGTITYDWFAANNGISSVIPSGLSLDTNQGIINGFLRFTPLYTTTYTFKMRVYKSSVVTGTNSYRERTFTLTVLGSVINRLTFSTPAHLGYLYQGEQSELYVSAVSSDTTVGVTYSLINGTLPPGLSLAIDGAIQGSVQFDSSATTVIKTYEFGVRARDSSLTNQVTGNFSISVYPYDGFTYTSIYLQAFPILESKDYYLKFINDESIFDPNVFYRKYDSNFGLQTSIKFILEHAIEQKSVDNYISAMQDYFYPKKLEFGEVKFAIAKDENGNNTYEVIYVDLIDNFVSNDGQAIGQTVQFDNQIVYPNSINNMRIALENNTKTNDNLLPKFMKTIQESTGLPLGRILCMPICYCLPGTASKILAKIQLSDFDFKNINFEVDRLVVVKPLDSNSTKYVLFPGRKI